MNSIVMQPAADPFVETTLKPGNHKELAILGGPPLRAGAWPKWPPTSDEALEALAKVLASTRWTLSSRSTGEPSYESVFAARFSAYTGVAHCVPCCSGTSALTIALEALGIGHGDEVLVPGLTWVACATAVARVGANPVLVDIDPATLCMSPSAARRALTPATKAIVLVHAYCSVADVDAFRALAQDHGLRLVEDCSQAHGALYRGHYVGGLGDVSTFSMQQSKLLTSGEGGAVLTNSPEVFDRLDQLRADGRRSRLMPKRGEFQLETVGAVQGHNYCLSEFHAALLTAHLQALPAQNELRSDNAIHLTRLLEAQGSVDVIYAPTDWAHPAIYRYCLRMRGDSFAGLEAKDVAAALTAELDLAVETLHPPLNQNALYRPSLSRRRPRADWDRYQPCLFALPEAAAAWRSCIAIPHHAFLGTSGDMRAIANAVSEVQRWAPALRDRLQHDRPAH